MMPPAALLAGWGLTGPRALADTRTSRLWRVRQGDRPAVVKVLKPEGAEELPGMALMNWYAGRGAARVLASGDGAVLMEELGPHSLGDLVREGGDEAATDALCDVIATLHGDRPPPPPGLLPLDRHFRALFHSDPDGKPAALARHLIATTDAPAALHGDLHHDNVLQSPRGWLVIDPKGLWGDPAYEAANVFRNPEGAEGLVLRPERIARLARTIGESMGVSPKRVLGWAAAHTALSICWHREDGTPEDVDCALLPLLMEAAV